jgi:hypothetical protein
MPAKPAKQNEPQHDEQVLNAVVVPNSPKQLPVVFNVTAEAIALMQAHADTLTIAGPEDKVGFKVVYDYRQLVRRQRIDVNRKKDELKAPHSAYVKEVDTVAKALTKQMEEIEEKLSKQEADYVYQREKIAQEKAMFEQQRTEGRIKVLRSYGYEWNERLDCYQLPGGQYFVNFDEIKSLNDEQYAPLSENTRQWHENEQARLAEEQRKADEAADRIEAEQKEERDRLDEIARKQKVEADRLAASARQLEERERQMQELEYKARLAIRTPKFVSMGFEDQEKAFVHPAVKYWKSYIGALTDDEFQDLLFKAEYSIQGWETEQKNEANQVLIVRTCRSVAIRRL